MEGCGNTVSCRYLFKKLQILPLTSQYILSSLMFAVQNKVFFLNKQWKITVSTLDKEIAYTFLKQTWPFIKKRAYYSGIKIFNNLPLEIKNVADNQKKKLKTVLKKFLYTYPFYTMEEYLSQSWTMYCITRFLL